MSRRDLPQQVFAAAHAGSASTVRYFLHKLPLGMVGNPPAPYLVTLVMDVRGRALEQFLTEHAALLRRLPVWTVVAVAPRNWPGLVACEAVFDRFLERRSSALGERPDEVRWFLTTRRAVDHGQWARLSVADIDRFRALRERLDTPEIETLYRDWLTHGEAALATRRPETSGAVVMNAGRLITEVLPFDCSQFGSLPGVA